MRKEARFTFVVDSFNRTAFANLIASLEGFCDSKLLRPIHSEELSSVDLRDSSQFVEIVAFSAMTTNFDKCAALMQSLRERVKGEVLTICGGSHATGRPMEVLESGFDYCCVGEGEEVLKGIVSDIRSSGRIGEIPGLLRLEDGKLKGSCESPRVEIDSHPALPLRQSFPTYIEAGRGCRWHCAYCQTPRIHGHIERFRKSTSIERVVAEYKDRGMKDFRLLLPNSLGYLSSQPKLPNCDALEDLLARVDKASGGAPIYLGSFPSEIRPDYVTPQAIAILKRYVANKRLVIGGQAASERLLRKVGREHTVEDIRKASEIVSDSGFQASVDLIFGLPDEQYQDREAAFEFMDELGRKGVVFNMHFFMPLPGTPLAHATPSFLGSDERRRLDRFASRGIVRGSWRRQEEMARRWVLSREEQSRCQ